MTDTIGKVIDDVIKRCRDFRKPTPKLRFCVWCLAKAKRFKTEEEMFQKAREGRWICPDAKEQCGKKVE